MQGDGLSLFKRKKTIFAALAGLGLLGLIAVYNCGKDSPTAAAGSQEQCLFCDFANGRQGPPPVLEVQTDEYVIFKDKSPAATYHYLAIPKQHFDSFNVLNRSHIGLVLRMESGMVELLRSKNVDPSQAIIGFHIPPFISVKHLHLHGIYPPSEMSFWNRINFMSSIWFKTAKDANEALELREL